jgi:hypothetical protein
LQSLHWNALTPLAAAMLAALAFRARWVGRLWTGGLAAFLVYGVCRAAWQAALR